MGTMREIPDMELHTGTEDWSALYVDGQLHTYGDSYLAEEAIRSIVGVRVVDDNAWLRGGNGTGRNGNPPPASTLDEVHGYMVERSERESRARNLRERAAELLAEAEGLDGKKASVSTR